MMLPQEELLRCEVFPRLAGDLYRRKPRFKRGAKFTFRTTLSASYEQAPQKSGKVVTAIRKTHSPLERSLAEGFVKRNGGLDAG